jgi:hypothetical protein
MSGSRTVAVFGVALWLAAHGASAQGAAPAAKTATAAPTESAPAAEAPTAETWAPHTGDVWVDRQLADINLYAGRYRGAFLDELVRYHAAPRALVTGLIVDKRWAPGDVYYACAVAQLAGRPCRSVVDAWDSGRADGWQAVAERVGLDAAAKARMKGTITDSFARWGRPLAKPAPGERAAATSKKSAARKTPAKTPRR